MTNRIIANLARKGGSKLLDLAVGRFLPVDSAASGGPTGKPRKSSIAGTLAGAALVRIATRSVPGAIVVGGGMLAKTLYDRKRARQAAAGTPAGPGRRKTPDAP